MKLLLCTGSMSKSLRSRPFAEQASSSRTASRVRRRRTEGLRHAEVIGDLLVAACTRHPSCVDL
jgi:hypothetical protein